MKTKTNIGKVAISVIVGGLLAGTMYAQLDIPTNIKNAIQTIQEIKVTSDGTNGGNMLIRLNGNGASATMTVSGTAIVGDTSTNSINGVRSSVLGGDNNKIVGNNSTIAGGKGNTINGNNSTIPGGNYNTVNGDSSMAAGNRAYVNSHNGTFVWSDNQGTPFASTNANQFLIRAQNGVGINTNAPMAGAALDVNGTVRFSGDINLPDGGAIRHGASQKWTLGADNTTISIGSQGGAVAAKNVGIYPQGTTTPAIYANTAGNVGIGTTTPSAKLDVAGRIRSTNSYEPGFEWYKEDDSLNQKFWDTIATAGNLAFRLVNDTRSAATTWLNVVRSAMGVTSITFPNGNVGIGTTTPSERLDVNGNISASGIGKFGPNAIIGSNIAAGYYQDASNGAYRALNIANAGYYFQSYNGTTTAMYIGLQGIYAGNVGIGTIAPGERVEVNGNIKISGGPTIASGGNASLKITTPSGYGEIGPQNPSRFHMITDRPNFYFNTSMYVNGVISAYNTNDLQLQTNGTTRIFARQTDGNVGIGTTTPRGAFDVANNGSIYLASNTTAGTTQSIFLPGHIYIAPYNGTDISYVQARRENSLGSTNLQFRTWNAGSVVDAMKIDNAGKVGIGTTTPGYKLDIVDNSTNNWAQRITNNSNDVYMAHGGGYGMHIKTNDNSATKYALEVMSSSDALLYVRNDGNIGVGTASPAYRMDIVGDVNANSYKGNIVVDDTRNANDAVGSLGRSVSYDFKTQSVIGLSAGGSYAGVMTIAPWQDDSGGGNHQLAFSQDGNLYQRYGTRSAGWGTRAKLLSTNSFGAGLTTNYVSKWNGSSLANSSLYDNGNVGIGTTTPSAKLDVNGSANINGTLSVATSISTPKLYVDNLVNRTVSNITVNGGLLPDAAAPVLYKTVGSLTNRWATMYSSNLNINGLSASAESSAMMVAADGTVSKRALNAVAFNGYTELDPQVGTLSNGKRCTSDGSAVNCTTDTPAFTYTETDPIFGASPAKGITSTNISNWNTAYSWGNHATAGYLKVETDPKVGTLTTNYVSKWNGSSLANSTLIDNGTSVGIGIVSPAAKLDVNGSLKINGSFTTPHIVASGTDTKISASNILLSGKIMTNILSANRLGTNASGMLIPIIQTGDAYFVKTTEYVDTYNSPEVVSSISDLMLYDRTTNLISRVDGGSVVVYNNMTYTDRNICQDLMQTSSHWYYCSKAIKISNFKVLSNRNVYYEKTTEYVDTYNSPEVVSSISDLMLYDRATNTTSKVDGGSVVVYNNMTYTDRNICQDLMQTSSHWYYCSKAVKISDIVTMPDGNVYYQKITEYVDTYNTPEVVSSISDLMLYDRATNTVSKVDGGSVVVYNNMTYTDRNICQDLMQTSSHWYYCSKAVKISDFLTPYTTY